jgi:amino acid transporter
MARKYSEERPLLAAEVGELGRPPSPAPKSSRSSVEEGSIAPQPEYGRLEDDVIPEESVLGRNLDWKSAYIIAISRVIGSGIFAVPGVILKSVGSVGLSLSLWVVGAVVTAFGLSISLEYGSMLPRSGGDKVYLEFTYPRPRFLASILVAAHAILLGFTASNCVIFSQYVHFALDLEPSDISKKALAVGLMSAITIMHGCWYKAGIRIQNFLGWVKIALVLFMVIAALWVMIFRPARDPEQESTRIQSWDELWEGSDWSFGTIATSLFKVFYSYTGLTNLNNVLNEVKDPVRTLRSVSITALATACLLYLLVNLAYLAVVPVEDIKQSGQLISALFFERTFGPNIGRRILPLVVALSAAGNVMVVTFSLVSILSSS